MPKRAREQPLFPVYVYMYMKTCAALFWSFFLLAIIFFLVPLSSLSIISLDHFATSCLNRESFDTRCYIIIYSRIFHRLSSFISFPPGQIHFRVCKFLIIVRKLRWIINAFTFDTIPKQIAVTFTMCIFNILNEFIKVYFKFIFLVLCFLTRADN